MTASYWPDGLVDALGAPGLPSIAYGSSTGMDGEGRITKVTGGSSNLINGVTYTNSGNGSSQAVGVISKVTYGSSDFDTFTYDPNTGRLTQYVFNVGSGPTTDTGNLGWNHNGTLASLGVVDNWNSADTQNCSYSYDDLSRLASANCGSVWSQGFTYDPFGNVTKTGSSSFQPGYVETTNQFLSLPQLKYDSDGNLLNDSFHAYTWDAQNQPTSIDSVSLVFDGLGRMVEQNRGGAYTQIVYSPGGGKLALMNGQTLQKAFVPLPGGGTAVYNSAGVLYYRHADWLGSSRFASTPTAPTTKYFDVAYAPFGEDYADMGTTDLNFTGKNQDTVSGLYDFLYREYHPISGRWVQPDPVGLGAVSMENPQSWNRYAYAGNGPLSGTDPLGLHEINDCLGCIDDSFGNPNAVTYYVDGIQVSSTVAQGLLASDSAAICPSDCSGFSNTGQYVQYVATAGAGPQGYVNFSDLQQGLYDANGTFMSGAQYNAYILSTFGSQIEAQRIALAQAIANNSKGTISYQQAYDSLNKDNGYLQGGNYNFGETTYGAGNLSCGADESRCNGVHFPDPGFVHLDTSNPFTGPLGFLAHGFVDLFLGNTAYTVIPRPWP